MENMINNYLNGNLQDAKKQAKRHSEAAIRAHLVEMGYSPNKSALVAAWLKGADCYQAACNAQ